MRKFKLKGKQLIEKHLSEMVNKAKSGIVFQVKNNPNIKSKYLKMYIHEVKDK